MELSLALNLEGGAMQKSTSEQPKIVRTERGLSIRMLFLIDHNLEGHAVLLLGATTNRAS